jgi:CBS domain-containing protein
MANIHLMQVKDIMILNPVRIRNTATLDRAAELIAMSRVTDLMVVDDENNFVGVLSEGDILQAALPDIDQILEEGILQAALPDIDQILEEGGSVETAFDLFLNKGRNLSGLPITPLIIEEPIFVTENDHIAQATVVLIDKKYRLLPVIKDGQLAGTVSRADICRAVVGTL